ncbi:hypothetical protein PoB_000121500 [Plakobranchus ocellatus]|uniref:Uncharacterized protein n=1 Tax=Plakobranchus ocellatus TaxID=259542 RepID=A0AAV3XWB9_9GAST|nr:hypothetical protein PoB_000121500 [Plakobranchus ocellatus]
MKHFGGFEVAWGKGTGEGNQRILLRCIKLSKFLPTRQGQKPEITRVANGLIYSKIKSHSPLTPFPREQSAVGNVSGQIDARGRGLREKDFTGHTNWPASGAFLSGLALD